MRQRLSPLERERVFAPLAHSLSRVACSRKPTLTAAAVAAVAAAAVAALAAAVATSRWRAYKRFLVVEYE